MRLAPSTVARDFDAVDLRYWPSALRPFRRGCVVPLRMVDRVCGRAREDRAAPLEHAVTHPSGVVASEGSKMKGSQKPKKLQKKAPQKTLKERRAKKRVDAQHARVSGV